ncbi:MAG: BTAD domain-containing putative transcriptional regulator [Actinomycetota bacterium]
MTGLVSRGEAVMARGAARIEVGILGPLHLAQDGIEVDPGPRKQRLLLLRLLVAHRRAVPVDRLVSALWGEDPPGSPTASLRAYASNLRALLEPDRAPRAASLLVNRADSYLLDLPAGMLDAELFEDDLDRARGTLDAWLRLRSVDQALDRWRGEPMVDAADLPFARPTSARLAGLRREAGELRVEALLELSSTADAVAAAEQLVADQPLDERGWALLMRSWYRAGRQADALRAYGRARSVLTAQLGVEPGPELRELEHRILNHQMDATLPLAPAAEVSGADEAPLVGRDAAFATLAGTMAAIPSGRRSIAVISGEAGVGKTRLLDGALRSLADSVLQVRVVCDPSSRTAGLLALGSALRDVLAAYGADDADHLVAGDHDALGELVTWGHLPTGRPDDDTDDGARYRSFDAIARLLGRLADRRPLVLVVEDAHWAGRPLWELLAFLATRPTLSFGVAVTFRPGEIEHEALISLSQLRRSAGAASVELDGLDVDAIERLAVHRLGEAAGSIAADLHRRTAGNAFFALELLRVVDPGDPVRSYERLDPPSSIAEVIRARVAELPDDAAELLTVGALVGSSFELGTVAAVVDRDRRSLLPAAEAAVRRGLLAEPNDDGTFAFRHDLVRDTVSMGMTRTRRAEWHARIGGVLARSMSSDPRVVADVARHLALGATAGTAMSAGEAARWAIASAFGRHESDAAAHLAKQGIEALEHAPPGPRRDRVATDLCCDLVVANRRLGDVGAAHAAARSGWAAALRTRDAAVMTRAALSLAGGPALPPWYGYWSPVPEAAGVVRSLLAARGDELPPADAVRLRAAAAWGALGHGRFADARATIAAADEQARAVGAPELVAMVLRERRQLADLDADDGPGDRRALTDELLRLAEDHDVVDSVVAARRSHLVDRLESGDLPSARSQQRRVEELGLRHGSEAISFTAAFLSATIDLFVGRLAEARSTIVGAYDRFGHFGPGRLGVLDLQLTRVLYEHHRMDEVEDHVRLRIDETGTIGWRAGLALLCADHGREDEARQIITDIGLDRLTSLEEPALQLVPACMLADAVAEVDDRAAAAELLELLGPRADRMATISSGVLVYGFVGHHVGRLLGVVGRDDDAVEMLQITRRRAEAAGSPLHDLRARVAVAELSARRGAASASELAALGAEAEAMGLAGVHAWVGRVAARS